MRGVLAGGFTRGTAGLPLCKWACSASWSRVQRGHARNEFAKLPSFYAVAPILLKAPFFSSQKGEEAVKRGRAEVVQQLPAAGWRLATKHRDLARKRLTEIAVDLDAVDAVPAKFEELVYRDRTPFVEGKARDIAKGDARFRIVLGNVPSSGSGDIEELRDKARVFFASLGVQRVASGKLRELYEKLVFGHRSES